MSHTDRVVVLVDMDCFYCQVEEKLNPSLEGKPIAVVQYNTWQGGGIIAVNYPARERGVTRHMRGNEAKAKCPEITLVSVPEVRGKADLTKYREAGKRVAEVLQTFTPLLERASVDEAYLDITAAVKQRIEETPERIQLEAVKNTYVVGSDIKDFLFNVYQDREYSESDFNLAFGGLITEEIRAAVYEKTGYRCSAGIAHNKILAKLVCGLHKPNKQTILPQNSVTALYENLPIRKIKSLGGKFGNALSETLGITNMGELIKFTEKELAKKFDDKTAIWLYNLARGIDIEPVTTRLVSKSIGCCKKFPGKSALTTSEIVTHWINELASEISERLEMDVQENNRRAKQMVVSFTKEINRKDVASSRTHFLSSYEQAKIAHDALEVVKKYCLKPDGSYNIKFLGISAGHFEDISKTREITSFFKTANSNISFAAGTSSLIKTADLNDAFPSDVMEEDDERDGSVYSATTEEMDEIEAESLVYFDNVFPERRGTDSPIQSDQNTNLNIADEDSITSEICPQEKPRPPSTSFFTRYFETHSNTGENSVDRNFNTSKSLEDIDCANVDDVEMAELPPDEKSVNFIDKPSTSLHEVCPECSKTVSKFDYVSHMDYHFALKMVKEEAHLYKNPTASNNNSSITSVAKNKQALPKKRKLDKTIHKSSESILAFLKKQDDFPVEISELCVQCNKRIRLEDYPNHVDYHTAKELHEKLNSSVKIESNKGKKNLTTNKKEKPGSIASFFKKA